MAVHLLVVLAVLLLLRVIVVLIVNHDRVAGDRLEGIEFHGRYYPVEKVCLVIDDGDLEEGLDGSSLDRGTFSLLATGNGFTAVQDLHHVAIDCGWKNWEYDKDPQVYFYFSADIRAEKIDRRPECRVSEPGKKAEIVSLGRYTSCRQDDGFEINHDIVDDNATVSCNVKSKDESLLPALERALRSACGAFIDRLARSRPITYWGNGFWTVR